ncbi:hypothetical protein F2Q68_00017623 [Brassica cretica]|uniref:Uncharacterized protein n=1 Tax=Brassica cretica TaxID=69181 RepID=A0A8S9HNF5_BRACR|nr:hypothetical protein F2Q68_00017623 [Brassica cretica]
MGEEATFGFRQIRFRVGATEESSSPTQTREGSLTSSRGKLSQWNDELINSFVGLADGVVPGF